MADFWKKALKLPKFQKLISEELFRVRWRSFVHFCFLEVGTFEQNLIKIQEYGWHGCSSLTWNPPIYSYVSQSQIFWKKSPLDKNKQKWFKMAKTQGFGLFKKIMTLVLSGIGVKWKLWFINNLQKLHWENLVLKL